MKLSISGQYTENGNKNINNYQTEKYWAIKLKRTGWNYQYLVNIRRMVTRISITIKLKSTGLFKGKFKQNITKLTKLFTNRLRGARGKIKGKKEKKNKTKTRTAKTANFRKIRAIHPFHHDLEKKLEEYFQCC